VLGLNWILKCSLFAIEVFDLNLLRGVLDTRICLKCQQVVRIAILRQEPPVAEIRYKLELCCILFLPTLVLVDLQCIEFSIFTVMTVESDLPFLQHTVEHSKHRVTVHVCIDLLSTKFSHWN